MSTAAPLGERVLVIGCPGSGKTVLTRRLAAATGLPAVHLDDHYFGPGWARPEAGAWERVLAGLLERPRWIMDGNHAATFARRLRAADTVVFLDYPFHVCAAGVVLRGIGRRLGRRHSVPRPVADDPRYAPRLAVSPRFVRLVLAFRARTRPRMLREIDERGGEVRLVRLGGRAAAERLLRELGAA